MVYYVHIYVHIRIVYNMYVHVYNTYIHVHTVTLCV